LENEVVLLEIEKHENGKKAKILRKIKGEALRIPKQEKASWADDT